MRIQQHQYPIIRTCLLCCAFWLLGSIAPLGAQCSNDSTTMVCNDQVVVNLTNGTATMAPEDILEGGPYPCIDIYKIEVDKIPPTGNGPWIPAQFDLTDAGKSFVVRVVNPANGNTCWGNVTVRDCTNDQTPPTVVCDAGISLVIDTVLQTTAVLSAVQVDQGSFDNCTNAGDLQFALTANYPNGPFVPTMTFAVAGTYVVGLQVTDEAGNNGVCLVEVFVNHKPAHLIEGRVFIDSSLNCAREAGEQPLAGWTVEARGTNGTPVYTTVSDLNGLYTLAVDRKLDSVILTLNAPFHYGGGVCPTSYAIAFVHKDSSQRIEQDIPVVLDDYCPVLFVDLATARIRGCFTDVYHVSYANGGAYPAEDTYVEVTLDPSLVYQSSSIPAVALGNNVYRFATGDLAPGQSGRFSITFVTKCNVPFGATHCSEAHIFPDTLCPIGLWSGADVVVEGICQNDSIYFFIENTGWGPNAAPLQYVVVEDVLMRGENEFQLLPGEVMALDPIPADGSTWVLQASQEPGHPYPGAAVVAVEGCGGLTPGIVTQFAINPASPFMAIDCRQNIGSYDPNDKQALPAGYGTEQFIEKNTNIDYMIRFQNTGTDTAYRVVILDTLSGALDAGKVRPGASSHDYRLEVLDGGILKFVFENILLPDSNVNLAGSQGFVQFRAPQTPDNPDGTVIENTGAIYFDFNAPVITNTTRHTVGSRFITTGVFYQAPRQANLRVFPNPAADRIFFEAASVPAAPMSLRFTDAQGRTVREIQAHRFPVEVNCSGFTPGLYFFQISDAAGGLLWSGRVVVK
ncbi:MAG: hypothetical protein SFV52_03560 [Saprospiraceae bacterium]|nr:hypothetical protein [Saprospiraceae bacterium]